MVQTVVLHRADLVRCLGLGALLSCILNGYCTTGLLTAVVSGQGIVLGIQGLSALVRGGCGLVLRHAYTRGRIVPRVTVRRLCTVMMLGGYAMLYFGTSWVISVGAACLLGMASIPLLVQWYEELLVICRDEGRDRGLLALTLSASLSLGIASVAGGLDYVGVSWAPFGVSCAAVLMSLVCLEVLDREFAPSQHAAHRDAPFYHLSSYAIAILSSSGLGWGVASYMTTLRFDGARSVWVAFVLTGVLCVVVLACFWKFDRLRTMRFGLLVRISIAISGVILVSLPVVLACAPSAVPVLSGFVVALQSVTMTLFAIEACCSTGFEVIDVLPTNLVAFYLSGCAAMLLCWIVFRYLEDALAWNVVALVSAMAAFIVVPALPSRGSDAATFTLDELPEDEGFAARAANTRDILVKKCGLTPRESEVLGLVLQGKSRQAIADELALSNWTVRDYVGSIYKKAGVHSAKELMVFVNRGE